MSVLCYPNLPDKPVKTVICGQHPEVISALRKYGADVIEIPNSNDLPIPVSNHADMMCCHCGIGVVVTADEALCAQLIQRGIDSRLICAPLKDKYPGDIALNCLVIGDCAIGRVDSLDRNLLLIFEENGIKTLNVKQGYARCSVAFVDEKSFITADKGIAKVLEAQGYEVLIVSQGGIRLDGYDTGFIGGCCGKISSGTMLFCGEVLSHPDGRRICDFLHSRGVTAECTHSGQLVDFGGFITLEQ